MMQYVHPFMQDGWLRHLYSPVSPHTVELKNETWKLFSTLQGFANMKLKRQDFSQKFCLMFQEISFKFINNFLQIDRFSMLFKWRCWFVRNNVELLQWLPCLYHILQYHCLLEDLTIHIYLLCQREYMITTINCFIHSSFTYNLVSCIIIYATIL